MARQTANAPAIELPEEIPLSPMQAENEAIEQNIMAAFDADPDSVTWDCKVYKLDRTAGNAEDYLFSILPGELDGLLDRLRDTEGTGTYRVRVYRKEDNKNRVFRQFDRRVKAPAKVAMLPQPQSDLTAILAAMERNNQRMIETVTAVLNRTPQYAPALPVQTDPFDMLTKMAAAMSGMMAAMRPAEGASSTDLILKGVELANTLGGNDKETNMLDVIRDAFKALPALAQMSGPPQLPAPGAPVPQPRPPQLPIKPNQTQVLQPEVQAQEQMRNMLLGLIPKAAKGSDTGLYAELLADEWGMEMVSAIITQPDLLPSLQALVPEISPYLPWFQSLLESLSELVNDARATASGSIDAPGKPHSPVNPMRNTGRPGWGENDIEDDE
jgi:hypothetical protein